MSEVRIFILKFSDLKNKKPFRLSKSGAPTNIFKKIESGNKESNSDANQLNFGINSKDSIKINLIGPNKAYMLNNEGEIAEEDSKIIP